MKKFLSVKEFSELSGVESSTLRYWDELGLFSPAARDPLNNYRCYSSEQIVTVKFIKVLSGLNIPLKTISEIENSRTPESIVRIIEQRERHLDLEMRELREAYSVMHMRRGTINYGRKVLDGTVANIDEISVVRMEEIMIILGPRNVYEEGEEFYGPFTRLCRQADDLRINMSFPIGGAYDDLASFAEDPGKPQNFFSLDPTGNKKVVAGDYLTGFCRGYYSQFGDLPERMLEYAKEHSLNVTGPTYAFYLHDELCIKDTSNYLVQVCVAIEK